MKKGDEDIEKDDEGEKISDATNVEKSKIAFILILKYFSTYLTIICRLSVNVFTFLTAPDTSYIPGAINFTVKGKIQSYTCD